MADIIDQILAKDNFSKEDIITLLNSDVIGRNKLYTKAAEIKAEYVGKKVYFRGLIEFSNICKKNCFYCGIRAGNNKVERYYVSEAEVLEAVQYAYDNKYASLVLQSGERNNKDFVDQVTNMLEKISAITNDEMGITLSMGEQTEETYKRWRDAGAKRYLLRIEASNRELYSKLHPQDATHDYDYRLDSLKTLQEVGYQVGTGVMIGLPFQTVEDLAEDLLFFQKFDIDMVGMGPYIEHEDTPLYQYKDQLISKEDRFNLSLKMVAILRIMMKDINIAATTAMQAIDEMGREKALKVGANVIMPNLTPVKYREGYLLYEDKPCVDEEASECKNCLEARIKMAGDTIGYGEQGNSKHYSQRQEKLKDIQ
ncbi:MAG: [FeFe] hydrogenase H-cluster radical SAM maturase HydE [Bacteroidales bacterium]|nr:[FeFe] hydrogenase H-cluster radical SAM maturase HydE [Bacteroidales bacterium]